jgi:hypothetical protein
MGRFCFQCRDDLVEAAYAALARDVSSMSLRVSGLGTSV